MARIRFTDGAAGNVFRRAPPGKTMEFYDLHTPSLTLRVGARGGSYLVVFRVKGEQSQRRRKIGEPRRPEEPDIPGRITLADARAKAQRIVADARAGISPEQREAEAQAAAAAEAAAKRRTQAATLRAVAADYFADKLDGGGYHLRSRPELERKVRVDLAGWLDRPIAEIKRKEIRELVRAKAQVAPASANRLLSLIKVLMAWAVAQEDLLDADPAHGIVKPAPEGERDRYLSDAEIALFWRGCEALGDPAGRIFKLALVLGQRRGEVAGMLRSELGELPYTTRGADGRERSATARAWLLPASRVKRNVAHTVPLSTLAISLIDGAPKPTDPDGEEIEGFDHIMASGRRGDQPVSGWSRYKRQLDEAIGRLIAKDAGEPYDPERHCLPEWHVHDLRATCATGMEEALKVPRPVVSRILNHAEGAEGRGSMTARYVRHKLDAEALDALERWGEHLAKLTGENVVALPGMERAS
jgi:integrase